jgi:hypothetical protein
MKERERRKIISDSIVQLRNVIPLSFNGDKLNQVTTMTLAIKYIKYLQEKIAELEGTYDQLQTSTLLFCAVMINCHSTYSQLFSPFFPISTYPLPP